MPRILVNVNTSTDASKLRREKRNGRDLIIVPSCTLPDNVVMNDIMYPAHEIEKAYQQLEMSPAPLGHPKINDVYVSARSPEGLNLGWVGAWNENVRRENGRVHLDKCIDIEVASRTEDGRRMLANIEEAERTGGAVHTSVAAYMMRTNAQDGAGYKYIGSNFLFDHDAILLDEPGAATPEQGVGLMVNSEERIEVITVDWQEREAVDAISHAVRTLQSREQEKESRNMAQRIVDSIVKMLSDQPKEAAGLAANEDSDMPIEKKEFDALAAKVDTLVANSAEQANAFGTALAEALKPVVEKLNALEANAKREEVAEQERLVQMVVNASLLSEEAAKTLSLPALKELASKVPSQAGGAVQVNGAFQPGQKKDEWDGYDMNVNVDEATKKGDA